MLRASAAPPAKPHNGLWLDISPPLGPPHAGAALGPQSGQGLWLAPGQTQTLQAQGSRRYRLGLRSKPIPTEALTPTEQPVLVLPHGADLWLSNAQAAILVLNGFFATPDNHLEIELGDLSSRLDGLATGQPIELPALVAQLDLQKVVGCGKNAIEHQAGGLGIGQPEVFAMAQHQHGLFGRDQPFTSSGFVSQAQAVAPFALGLEGLGLARRQQKALAAVGTWRHTGWGRPQRRRYLEPQTIVGLGGRDCAGGRRRGWRLVF